jgi:uncharacterized membrane protein
MSPVLKVMFPRSGSWFAALLAIAIFAFWPSYFGRLPGEPTIYMHVHAAVMLAWMALLIAQPVLIRARRPDLHRALGQASYVLAPAAVASAILLAHSRFAPMAAEDFARAAPFLYLPLAATMLFALTSAFAIAWRRRPPVHARFMICTGLTLIDPVVARILGLRFPPLPDDRLYPLIGYGLTELVLLALVVVDRNATRGRRVFPAVLALFAVVHLGFFTLAQAAAWVRFAAWFRALPLTG